MTTAAELWQQARVYVGVKFRHQGRSRKEGLDCAGLVIKVAHDLGLSEFDFRAYRRLPDGEMLLRLCDQNMIRTLEIGAGAVLAMRIERKAQHLGIVGLDDAGELTLIHSARMFGEVVEHRLDELWRRRTLVRYHLRGVAY